MLTQKDITIAELRAKLDNANERILELQAENRELHRDINRLDRELFEVNIKNEFLVNAIKKEDTEIFIYNGETYNITKLSLHKEADSVDTLDVELKKINVISRTYTGLCGAFNEAVENIRKSLIRGIYGDNVSQDEK